MTETDTASPAPVAATPEPVVEAPAAPAKAAPTVDVEGDIVLGSELEAALRERVERARELPPKYWKLNGQKYRLQPYLAAGTMLSAVEAQSSRKFSQVIDSIRSFFYADEGQRFIDDIKDMTVDAPPDLEYFQDTIKALTEAAANRPFGK